MLPKLNHFEENYIENLRKQLVENRKKPRVQKNSAILGIEIDIFCNESSEKTFIIPEKCK